METMTPKDMARLRQGFADLRALHGVQEYRAAFELVTELLQTFPGCAALWIDRGNLIQLAHDLPESLTLEDIESSLQCAQVLAPRDAEPDIELGHFHYAVMDDARRGDEHFAKAEAKALDHLREALEGRLKCARERGDEAALSAIEARLAAMSADPGRAQ
jgi:hypothetical protein